MNLVTTVLGIGLVAMIMTAGISHVGTNFALRAETTALTSSGFAALDTAWHGQRMAGGITPQAGTWKTDLFTAPQAPPRAPKNGIWSYGTTTAGDWFCLSGPLDLQAALSGLVSHYPAGVYEVSGACGDAKAPITTGISATYWLSKS